MTRTKSKLQAAFNFDEPASSALTVVAEPVFRGAPVFREVAAATFLAWPWSAQVEYCALRDEDTAAQATDPDDVAWFLARAATYRAQVGGR